MRIIGGIFRGRKLANATKLTIRPATDRVKQTIFDVLNNHLEFSKKIILDTFAGTGSLGIEALSRGAEKIIFVENSFSSIDIIKKNISILNMETHCKIVKSDAINFFNSTQKKFDLIFADPPYSFELTKEIPKIIFEKNILNANGILVIEHTKHCEKFLDENNFYIFSQKKFGQTIVSFFKHNEKKENNCTLSGNF